MAKVRRKRHKRRHRHKGHLSEKQRLQRENGWTRDLIRYLGQWHAYFSYMSNKHDMASDQQRRLYWALSITVIILGFFTVTTIYSYSPESDAANNEAVLRIVMDVVNSSVLETTYVPPTNSSTLSKSGLIAYYAGGVASGLITVFASITTFIDPGTRAKNHSDKGSDYDIVTKDIEKEIISEVGDQTNGKVFLETILEIYRDLEKKEPKLPIAKSMAPRNPFMVNYDDDGGGDDDDISTTTTTTTGVTTEEETSPSLKKEKRNKKTSPRKTSSKVPQLKIVVSDDDDNNDDNDNVIVKEEIGVLVAVPGVLPPTSTPRPLRDYFNDVLEKNRKHKKNYKAISPSLHSSITQSGQHDIVNERNRIKSTFQLRLESARGGKSGTDNNTTPPLSQPQQESSTQSHPTPRQRSQRHNWQMRRLHQHHQDAPTTGRGGDRRRKQSISNSSGKKSSQKSIQS